MRLFIAANFSAGVISQLYKIQRKLISLSPSIILSKKENLHLTLKFLGNTNAVDLDEDKIISDVSSNIQNCTYGRKPFALKFGQLNTFHAARTIVTLVVNKTQPLVELVSCLEMKMQKIGFSPENREYQPHATLGRYKNLNPDDFLSIKAALDKLPLPATEEIFINRIYLVQSILTRNVPIYKSLHEFVLV